MTTHSPRPRHWLIIPAAGIGSRMASDIPKQYLTIHDKTILQHTIEALLQFEDFEKVLVALHPKDNFWPDIAKQLASFTNKVNTYTGGNERAESVLLGLKALSRLAEPEDWVWVHDAARPLVSRSELSSVAGALECAETGTVLALQATDTIKKLDADGEVSTIPREQIWRAQTPQVFRLEELLNAYQRAINNDFLVTDESSAIEAAGGSPTLVPGLASNIKITVPEDMAFAKSHLATGENIMSLPFRIGSGFDVHAYCEGKFLTLGGVQIPFDKAFKAHSDGDVLLHAICDALLGALALGDIGKHFPDTDERWKGANSRDLLKAVVGLVQDKGYVVGNVDATIVAQAPKMAPHIMSMRENIASDLSVDVSTVSVKATTSERLGFEGRQEGISCQATVLLQEKRK